VQDLNKVRFDQEQPAMAFKCCYNPNLVLVLAGILFGRSIGRLSFLYMFNFKTGEAADPR